MNVAALEEAEDRRKRALLRELERLQNDANYDSESSIDLMELTGAEDIKKTCSLLEQKMQQISTQQMQIQERIRAAGSQKSVSFVDSATAVHNNIKSPPPAFRSPENHLFSPALSSYSTQAALPLDPQVFQVQAPPQAPPQLVRSHLEYQPIDQHVFQQVRSPPQAASQPAQPQVDIQSITPVLIKLCNELHVSIPHNITSSQCVVDILSNCVDSTQALKKHCEAASQVRVSPPRTRLESHSHFESVREDESHGGYDVGCQGQQQYHEPEVNLENISRRKDILKNRIRDLLHKREITKQSVAQQLEALQRSQLWWSDQKSKHVTNNGLTSPLKDVGIFDMDVRESTSQCEQITQSIQGFISTIDEAITNAQTELQQLNEIEMSTQYVSRREPSV